MHFPVNQLAHCAAVYPSPSLQYWLVKRISFRSQTQSRDHKPQKFAAPELTDLHVKLFFSFHFFAVNFSAISFGAPQIRGEYYYSQVIMVHSVRALHALAAAPPANGNRQKTDYDYVHSESAETATRATSWACPSLIRRSIVPLLCHCPLSHTMLRDFT